MGRELVCGIGSPACGTGALILSLFSCSTQLPFKTAAQIPFPSKHEPRGKEGRVEKTGGSQTLLSFIWVSFPPI